MEKNRQIKAIAIVALIVAVVGLGIGFAAFSSTLTINSSVVAMPDASDFVVNFSKSSTTVSSGTLTPTSASTGVSNTSAVIVSGTSFTMNSTNGIGFTEPGQSVTYDFYVRNDGKYTAYLNSIVFGMWGDTNTVPNEPTHQCTKVTGGDVVATDSLVQAACSSMYMTITYTESDGTSQTLTTKGKGTTPKATLADIDGFTIEAGESGTIKVVFAYDSTGSRADGPFKVSFANVKFNYSTVD